MPNNQPTRDLSALARLAGLSLSPEEEAALACDLCEILAFAETLSEAEDTQEATPLPAVLREDIVREGLPREAVLALAPTHDEGHVTLPEREGL